MKLPDSVIYGISYNTSGYGPSPYGYGTTCALSAAGCGYDSLNVGYSESPAVPTPGTEPSVGSDPNPGTAYLQGTYANFYCDNGAGGTGTFRIDGRPDTNNCWNGGGPNTGYSYAGIEGESPVLPADVLPYVIPSVQFNAVSNTSPSFTSLNNVSVVAGTSFSFTVTTTGVPLPVVVQKIGGKLPKGLTLAGDPLAGTATISGKALTTDRNGTYTVIVRARNGKNSVAKQHLLLTLSGGR